MRSDDSLALYTEDGEEESLGRFSLYADFPSMAPLPFTVDRVEINGLSVTRVILMEGKFSEAVVIGEAKDHAVGIAILPPFLKKVDVGGRTFEQYGFIDFFTLPITA